MTYPQVKEYLYSFINYENLYRYPYEQSFNLNRIKTFLEIIGNPQSDLKVIHVAGSKGKGSVSIFIANILKHAGFKVGLYTSPHLNDFRERLRILDKSQATGRQSQEFQGMISKREICNLVSKLKPSIDKFDKTAKYGALTFFEVYTALALEYFKHKKVDFVILETGLGGRLDATNTCHDLLSIITPISLEHTCLLGKTIKHIAREKASIIKRQNQKISDGRILALSAKQDRTAMSAIEKMSKRNKALLFREGKDFSFSKGKNNHFTHKGLNYNFRNLSIKLTGRHQAANASLAIASVEALRYHNIDVSKDAVRQGLKNCIWPGRFEIISKKPTVIIDGAQNSSSVRVLGKTLKEEFPNRKIWLIFSIARDKEIRDTCSELKRISENIILTRSTNPRTSDPKDLTKYFKKKSVFTEDSLKLALELAKSKVCEKDLIVITGSLYLCGEVKRIIGSYR